MRTALPSRFRSSIPAILGLVLVLCAACATSADGPEAPDAMLAGAWSIESVEGAPLADANDAHLVFDPDGRLSGHAGVNRVSATWSLDADGLALTPLVTTRMAGPPELMEDEHRLLAALERVRGAEVDGAGQLVLRAADGAPLVRATRR